jgi:hypothetical protein
MTDTGRQHLKAFNSIKRNIERLQLNLKGLTILTEVGSGSYLYTPFIPLLAGAGLVVAFVKDSNYGSADEIEEQCVNIKHALNIAGNLEIVKNHLPSHILHLADIITNSGMLRPLDSEKLQHVHSKAVIPLMFEKWELREGDIDTPYCKSNGIPIAGTWEQHPDIRVFDYVGNLAVKMLYEAGQEIRGQRILIWSDDEFGKTICAALLANGAECTVTTNKATLQKMMTDIDVIFIADYDEQRCYIGSRSPFDIHEVANAKPGISIVHLYGDVPYTALNDINIHPRKIGKPMMMSHTLAHVGIEPVIRLQVAGFKVGQELYYHQLSTLSQLL